MPTYEYKCDACRHRFEEVQSMSAKHLRRCPKCGKNRLQRLISSGAGLIFKGSGFYATDYKSSRSGGPPETKPETKSETKSDSKSDSKPGKTGETKASSSDSGSDKSCGSCGKTGPNVCD
jgi:putative FmdB family regulatory protein